MAGFPRYRENMSAPRWNYGDVYGYTIVYVGKNPSKPDYWIEYSRVAYKVGSAALTSQPSGEKCWDELHKGPPYLTGGPLTIRRFTNETVSFEPQNSGNYRLPNSRHGYIGGWYCSITPENVWSKSTTLGDGAFADFEDAMNYGATGWNRARPGRPGADLGLFLAEIKEVPKMFRDTALFFRDSYKSFMSGASKSAKHAANTWLGLNFGWLPFVSDLRKFAQTTRNLDRSLKQLQKDNGKWVRRRRTVEEAVGSVSDTGWVDGLAYHYPTLNTYWYNGAPYHKGRLVVERQAKFWFEASFRYWIPDIGSYQWKRRAIRKLYGANLNPELLWEATPFSWLVDWCSNIGDIFANMDNNLAENLVAKYAYIMGSQRLVASVYTEHNYKPVTGCPRDFSSHFNLILKERKSASPFGFALSGSDFTARQWSLLTALGLQRHPFR